MSMSESMTLLLVALNACHWAGDFTHLSRPFMLSAKRFGSPVLPIAAHAGVHTVLMALCVLLLYGSEQALVAAFIQFPTHFAIDVMKGRINKWFAGVQDPTKYPHWYVFGADQLMHQLVIIATVYAIA